MSPLKEVNFIWFIFVGLVLLGAAILETRLLKQRPKKVLAFLLWVSSVVGVFLLALTDLGSTHPLRSTFLKDINMTLPVQQGMEVYLKYGCPNCHQLNGWGTPAGPDMAGIVSRSGKAWVKNYLVDPSFRGHSSAMPYYDSMSREEMDRLLDFLSVVPPPKQE